MIQETLTTFIRPRPPLARSTEAKELCTCDSTKSGTASWCNFETPSTRRTTKRLIDDAIAKTRATTNTIISSADTIRFPEGGSIEVNVANYRVQGWFFDQFASGSCPSFDGVCHEILPTPSSAYKPKEFWLSVDNQATHELLVRNTCTEWIPSFRYLPGPVAAYSGI